MDRPPPPRPRPRVVPPPAANNPFHDNNPGAAQEDARAPPAPSNPFADATTASPPGAGGVGAISPVPARPGWVPFTGLSPTSLSAATTLPRDGHAFAFGGSS
ncbi:hypothetical protein BC828DRAFT_404462, partial [Blastocladiella britannica]